MTTRDLSSCGVEEAWTQNASKCVTEAEAREVDKDPLEVSRRPRRHKLTCLIPDTKLFVLFKFVYFALT